MENLSSGNNTEQEAIRSSQTVRLEEASCLASPWLAPDHLVDHIHSKNFELM